MQLRQNPTANRIRMTIDQKCALLDELKELENENIPLAQTVLQMMHPLISAKNISVWSKLREKLFSAKDQGFDYCRYLAVASRVHFPEQEKLQGLRTFTLNYTLCTLFKVVFKSLLQCI